MFNSIKMYHRTNFWGTHIRGSYSARVPGNKVVHCQVVLENYLDFMGCCNPCGKRVAELKEVHFLSHYSGNWNLFLVDSKMVPRTGCQYFIFCILPEYIDQSMSNWKFQGNISPHMVRMGLAPYMNPILDINKDYQFPVAHVHLMVVMDKFTSYDQPWLDQKFTQEHCLSTDLIRALDATESSDLHEENGTERRGHVVDQRHSTQQLEQRQHAQEKTWNPQEKPSLSDFLTEALNKHQTEKSTETFHATMTPLGSNQR